MPKKEFQNAEEAALLPTNVFMYADRELRSLVLKIAKSRQTKTARAYSGINYLGSGIRFKNRTFELVPFDMNCKCGPAAANHEHRKGCPADQPNFRCGDFEIRWFKVISPRLRFNRTVSLAELEEIFLKCEESLKS